MINLVEDIRSIPYIKSHIAEVMKHEIIWSKDAGDELAEIISYIKYNTGKMTAEIISIIDGRRNLEEILYRKMLDGSISYER